MTMALNGSVITVKGGKKANNNREISQRIKIIIKKIERNNKRKLGVSNSYWKEGKRERGGGDGRSA